MSYNRFKNNIVEEQEEQQTLDDGGKYPDNKKTKNETKLNKEASASFEKQLESKKKGGKQGESLKESY